MEKSAVIYFDISLLKLNMDEEVCIRMYEKEIFCSKMGIFTVLSEV
jgi:hypothetical protein